MLKPQLLPTAEREGICSPRGILHLPSINIPLRELPQLRLRHTSVGADSHASAGQKRTPDLRTRRRGQRAEVQRNVDAREERFVEGLDAVRGEEEDTRVIFEVAQEAGDHSVALEVVQATLLEEDIGFVDEDDGFPGSCEICGGYQ